MHYVYVRYASLPCPRLCPILKFVSHISSDTSASRGRCCLGGYVGMDRYRDQEDAGTSRTTFHLFLVS